MKRLGAAAVAAWATFAIVPASASISEDLKFCAGLKSSKERLACYDAAARIENTSSTRVVRQAEPAPAAVATTSQSVMDAHAAFVTKAPPPLAKPSWQGFYIGANGGWAADGEQIDFRTARRFNGWLAGGQIGYNAQVGQIVVGLVGDVQAADIGGYSDTRADPHFVIATERNRIDVFGTARAKLGFDLGPVLLYGTGGLAWARNKHSLETKPYQVAPFSPVQPARFFTEDKIHFGFAGGGGIEARIADNWSVFAEYLYVSLQPTTYDPATSFDPPTNGLALHVARGGVSYWFR